MLKLHFQKVALSLTPFTDLNLRVHKIWGKMLQNCLQIMSPYLSWWDSAIVSILQVLAQYAVKNETQTNGIAQHVTKTKHQIDWENTIFLDSETHWRRRKIKEALYIDIDSLNLNPGKQISNNIMNLEKGFDISSSWKEFSSDIRKSYLRKFQT